MVSFHSFSNELQKIAGKVPLPRAAGTIFRDLVKGSPVKVKVTDAATAFGGGFYDAGEKTIGVTKKDYESLAHELGHVEVDKHILGKLIQSRISRLASDPLFSSLAGVGAGLLIAKGKEWGILLPAVLSTPMLLSEYLASRKGGKLLEDAGADKEQQKEYKTRMRKGLATYLAPPAIGTLVAHAVGRNH